MMTFTYLVVGAGSIGKRHFENLESLGRNVKLLPWRAFDLLGFEKFLRENREHVAVVIATSTPIRLEMISLCAAFNVPMYIEKPAGYEPKALEQIYSIPEALQERSVVGFMMRYHPVVRFLVSHRPEGLFRSHLSVGHDVNQWRSGWRFSQSYASDPNGGGVLLDLCHEIDIACLLASDLRIDSVSCLEHPDFKGVDVASAISAHSETAGIWSIDMDYLAPSLVRRGSLEGIDGSLDYSLADNTVHVSAGGRDSTKKFDVDRNSLFIGLMTDFISLAENGPHMPGSLCPRMDLVGRSCNAISDAWTKRSFVGQIKADLQ